MAIQGIANVFNVAVNVLSSENPSMIRVVPNNAIMHQLSMLDLYCNTTMLDLTE